MCYSGVPLSVERFLYLPMNVLDIVLAVPMLWLIYCGWRRGLVREVATLVGVLAGIWAAIHLSQTISELIGLQGEDSVIIAFFIAFVGALVLAYLLGRMVEGVLKAANLSIANRLAGATLGLIKALCILAVLLNNAVMLDRQEKVITKTLKEDSKLYKPVWDTGNRLTASLKQFIEEHKDEWKEATK